MIEKFFNPKSIAIIGASDTKGKIGNILLENLQNGGYQGKIFPVNPKHDKIGDLECFESVLKVKSAIDLAILAVPADYVLSVVKDCQKKENPIKNIIVISAGFSEIGKEGAERENALKKIAKENQINLLGPNCLGVINTAGDMNASFARKEIKKGEIGLVMQSGALVTALLDLAEKENFGFSSIVTLGNKTCLDENDFMEYFLKDEKTKAVVFYLENISRGLEFKQKLAELAKKKKVFVLKAGRSEKVKKAIQSHTGAMAGEFEIVKNAVEESGGIYFENIADLVNALKMFSGYKHTRNNKVVVITNAGGPGVIAVDLIEQNEKVELLELSIAEKEQLKRFLPLASSVGNPIDILGDAVSERYEKVLEEVSVNEKVGAVLAIITPQAQTDIEKIAEVIKNANEKCQFPIIPIFIGGKSAELAEKILIDKGRCNFKFPIFAVEALSVLLPKKDNSARNLVGKKEEINPERQTKVKEIFEKVLAEKRNGLFYEEASSLVDFYGIETNKIIYLEKEKDIDKIDEELFPLVMKVDSPQIVHKDAEGGVILGIVNRENLKSAYEELREKFGEERILIQRQIPAGLEIILGIKKDASFGNVVMCGLGGIFAEVLDEKILWFDDANKSQIKQTLLSSKIGKIFIKKRLEIDDLVGCVHNLCKVSFENNQIKELDINPIMFYNNLKPIAVDVKIMI